MQNESALNLEVSQGTSTELECWNHDHGEKIAEATCVKVNVRDWTPINDSNTEPSAGQARTIGANGSNNHGCSAHDAQSSSQIQSLELQTESLDKGKG